MRVVIYSRKSKLTEKGDSIENQVKLCRDYAEVHFGVSEADVTVYEDEGFSGGNTYRPEFQNMLKNLRDGKYDVLICYRLDRISRSVSDFSQLINEMERYGVNFVSIREQFDTTTPMGRAMMYIASVFAQLERETIAERIRDNMRELSKSGRWLGGNTPTGFVSEKIDVTDKNGNRKKAYRLNRQDDEARHVELLFDKFLELGSLSKLETYCLQNNLKTKHGNRYTRHTLRGILTNVVYVKPDRDVYEYLRDSGFKIYSSEDEFLKGGVISYNKTNNTPAKNRQRGKAEWIIAASDHEGIIDADRWLRVQQLITKNKSKAFRKVRNTESLLSGMLKCDGCGGFMRPKLYGNPVADSGKRRFAYMCEIKERSKKASCSMNNVSGELVDGGIIDMIKSLELDIDAIRREMNSAVYVRRDGVKSETELAEQTIRQNAAAIARLVESLKTQARSSAAKYIIAEIEALDAQNETLRSRTNKNAQNAFESIKALCAFSWFVEQLSLSDKRKLIGLLFSDVRYNGATIIFSVT